MHRKHVYLAISALPWAQGVGRSNRPAPTNGIIQIQPFPVSSGSEKTAVVIFVAVAALKIQQPSNLLPAWVPLIAELSIVLADFTEFLLAPFETTDPISPTQFALLSVSRLQQTRLRLL